MWTVGRLAARFNVSRSTLLYYDKIGLLCPSQHSAGEYRRYSKADEGRLEQIMAYRRAGLSLTQIKSALDGPQSALATVLEARLAEIDEQVQALRSQQRLVAELLCRPELLAGRNAMDRKTWVALLREMGMTEEDMDAWHAAFERNNPEKHQEFMQYLGIPAEHIRIIRKRSREWSGPSPQASPTVGKPKKG